MCASRTAGVHVGKLSEGRGYQKFDDKLYEEVVVFVSKLMPLNTNDQDVFKRAL